MGEISKESFLLCLAQLGIAFACFTGVIYAFRQRSRWTVREVNAIKFIFEHTFALVLCSLLPILFFYFLGSEDLVWRISNGLIALIFAMLLVAQVIKIRKQKKSGEHQAHPKSFFCGYFIPITLLCIIESYNVTISSGSSAWYAVGLLFLLFGAAIQFWLLLLLYIKNSNKKGQSR